MNKHQALKGLYGITPTALLTNTTRLLNTVESALQGGMRILQYRNKDTDHPARQQQARDLQVLCRKYQALLIINDDVELASAIGADGIHLGNDDASLTSARKRLGKKSILGCSCYNQLDRANQARNLGADYVAFGRFFPSRTKPQAVQADPAILLQARSQLDMPICAIGGITTQNAGSLVTHGADMIAVIDDLFSARNINHRAKRFSALFGN